MVDHEPAALKGRGIRSRSQFRLCLRIIATLCAVASTLVLVATTKAESRYFRHAARSFYSDDGRHLLLPLLLPALAFSASVLIIAWKPRGKVLSGALVGGFVGANLFLTIPALVLLNHYELVAHDGTAQWGMLYLPSFWLGLPLTLGGVISGVVIGAACRLVSREIE